jgi:esterase/lipase
MSPLRDFQLLLSRRLLLWSALSCAVGAFLVLLGDPFWRGFGVQAVVWGLIDAAIAFFGQRSADKRRGAAPQSLEQAEREARKLRRLLWINTGLDVVYVAVGLAVVLRWGQSDPFAAGAGWGIVLQGGFLFAFDLLHARATPDGDSRLPSFPVFQGPEHAPFILKGGQPAALLVHGFGGTPAEMRGLAESLHSNGWTVQAVLLPGFGADLATLVDRSWREWVDAVRDAAGALVSNGHQPLMLVGYSMGATVALAAAPDDLVDRLALIAPFWWQEAKWMRLADLVVRPFLPASFRPLRNANLDDPRLREAISKFMPGINLEDPDALRALREFRAPLSLIDQVRAVSRAAYAAASEVRVPVLVVQGGRDPVVRTPATRRLLSRMRCPTQYVEVDGAHDMILPDHAGWEETQRMVTAFAAGPPEGTHRQTSTPGLNRV